MRPQSETELADMIRAAKGPLAVVGGGTRGVALEGEPLSTAALSGVVLYEPAALTLVVRAGTPLRDVEETLARSGQRLAFEPMDHRRLIGTKGEPTMGGVIAANVSGPRRVQVGAARDFLLGARFVDGVGNVIKSGGRVMKNVTGLDVARLMAGAHGTLGVLTEVSLKVLPDVEKAATLVLRGLDPARAVAVMAKALGSPWEVTGAAHDPEAGETCLRIEGFAASVDYRAARIAAHLSAFGAAEIESGGDRWRDIRDGAGLAGRDGDLWRLSVKPSDGPTVVARAGGMVRAARYDWGGGLIWLLTDRGADLRGAIGVFDGHATLMRAEPATYAAFGRFQPETATVAALTRGLRARFDPRGILNKGLMG